MSASIEQAELLRTWVAALRSGKYPKTEYFFRNSKGYCAVGVLCDVGGVKWRKRRSEVFGSSYDCDSAPVTDLVFGNDDAGRYVRSRIQDMNDMGRSFAEVADEIERRFPDVFGESIRESQALTGAV